MAQLVKCLTFDFGSGPDLPVHEFESSGGAVQRGACLRLSLSLLLSLSLPPSLNKQTNKQTLNKLRSARPSAWLVLSECNYG